MSPDNYVPARFKKMLFLAEKVGLADIEVREIQEDDGNYYMDIQIAIKFNRKSKEKLCFTFNVHPSGEYELRDWSLPFELNSIELREKK